MESLVYDATEERSDVPGLHAFIVGVSNYPFLPTQPDESRDETFGLSKLNSTSLSACRILSWLLSRKDKPPAKLVTCRLLLTPTSRERETIRSEGLLNGSRVQDIADVPAATLDNFLQAAQAWRESARASSDNITLFYFAGHGTQRTGNDAVLLLGDFANGQGGLLHNAVDIANIQAGMATTSTRPKIAQTQLYFVDACRDFSPFFAKYQFEETTRVFPVENPHTADLRSAPVFFAAAPGTQAQAVPDEGTLFSQALLSCLNNDAGEIQEIDGEERWHVSVDSLKNALPIVLETFSKKYGVEQFTVAGGLVKNKVVFYLDKTPSVQVTLEILPERALDVARVTVIGDHNPLPELPHPLQPHPYTTNWKAGYYRVGAHVSPDNDVYTSYPMKIVKFFPPHQRKVIPVKR